jgi:hypothetical protein
MFLIHWTYLFFSSKHNGNAYALSFDNSTAMYNNLKTLHPGGIRTRDLMFCRGSGDELRKHEFKIFKYKCFKKSRNLDEIFAGKEKKLGDKEIIF